MYKDLLGIVSVLCMVWYPHQVVAEESLCHLDFTAAVLPQRGSRRSCMGISQSTLAMENGPERAEHMEGAPAPGAEADREEPTGK